MFPGWPCHPLQRPAQCRRAGQEAPWPQAKTPGAQRGLLEALPTPLPAQASRGRPRHVTQSWGGAGSNPSLFRQVSSGSKSTFSQ